MRAQRQHAPTFLRARRAGAHSRFSAALEIETQGARRRRALAPTAARRSKVYYNNPLRTAHGIFFCHAPLLDRAQDLPMGRTATGIEILHQIDSLDSAEGRWMWLQLSNLIPMTSVGSQRASFLYCLTHHRPHHFRCLHLPGAVCNA